MSKNRKQDLFLLINTLSKSEKRHFKLFASKHAIGGRNKYVKLFDAIAAQKDYNEKKLLSSEKYIVQLPQLKSRLYDMILKSLRVYDSKPSPDVSISHLLFSASVLEKKGLYAQSLNTLVKAKEISVRYEKHLKTAEIIRREEELLHLEHRISGLEAYVNHGFREEMEHLEKYERFRTYKFFDTQIGILVRKQGESLYPETLARFKEILKKKIFQKEAPQASFEERLFFRNVQVLYHYFTADFSGCYIYAKKCLQLFDANPLQRIDKPQHYISIVSNLLIIQMKLEKYDELLITVNKFRDSSSAISPYVSKSVMDDMIAKSLNVEIAVYLKTAEFEKGISILPRFEKELLRLENPEYRILLYSQVTKLFFGNRNYTMALKWINRLLNDTSLAVREDIHCLARIMNLIIHYELNNLELLEHIVKSTGRFLSRRNRLYALEKTILDFFRKNITPGISRENKISAFVLLKKKIAEALKERDKNYVLDYFDFPLWVESKIREVPMKELLKEKSGKRTRKKITSQG